MEGILKSSLISNVSFDNSNNQNLTEGLNVNRQPHLALVLLTIENFHEVAILNNYNEANLVNGSFTFFTNHVSAI